MGLAFHALLALAVLAFTGFRPERFLQLGRLSPSWDEARRVLGPDVEARGDYGHDGKEFWLLARDPTLQRGEGLAHELDRPAYRAQRILYPLLAAPWRLAGERALVWGLLVTNLLAVAAGGYVAALLAMEVGASPWAGLAFAANPATITTVLHDGCDVVALAALLGTLLLLQRGRAGRAAGAATLATLAKEASLLAIAGVAVLGPGLSLRSRLRLLALPVGVALAWGLYARWRLGWPGTAVREFTPPFVGYVQAWGRGAPFSVLLVPLAVFTLWLWWRRRSLLLAATVPFAIIVPFLSANVLTYSTGALRAFGPGVTLVALELLSGRRSKTTSHMSVDKIV